MTQKSILMGSSTDPGYIQAVTKRAGRKKDASSTQASSGGGRGGQPQVKKAVFESTKKKEVGVSDLTLISKISNEAINDNLKKRFENAEIYVCGRAITTAERSRRC
jgi:myosin-1